MWIESYCDMPFNRVRVTPFGDLAFCCFQRPDPASNKPTYIGNLLKNSFDQIWFGEVAEQIRQSCKDGVLHERCQCPGCPTMSCVPPYKQKNVVFGEYPAFLEIDLPNIHCNIGGNNPNSKRPACVMCERASPLFKPDEDRLMEVLPKLIHLMPNLFQIHIQGIAEPFWKDLLFRILDVIDFEKHKDRITLSTTTNGTLLNRRRRKEYLDRAPNSITNFSIDASSPETYKGIRTLGGKVFEKVLNNFYNFSAERIRDKQFLRMTNNINIMNIHEVIGMVHIAKKANVEFVEFNATDGFNHLITANLNNCVKFYKAQKEIVSECEKIGLPYSFVRPLDMGLSNQLMKVVF